MRDDFKDRSGASGAWWRIPLIATLALTLLTISGEQMNARVGTSAPREVASQQEAESAASELKQGKYVAAIDSFTRLLTADPRNATAQAGLLQARIETGQYREAELEAQRFLALPSPAPEIALLLGEILALTGRDGGALPQFLRATKAESVATRLRAELRRGEILAMTGQEDEARKIFKLLADYYDENVVESAPELTTIARALVHLEKYQEANDLYLEAVASDGQYIEAQLGGGELYTSKYNYAEAAQFFIDALKINEQSARAHLGIALNKRIGGGDEMNAALTRALKINPRYVEARTLAAALDLEAERFTSARTQIDEALATNPRSLEAHALRAASHWLQDQPDELAREIRVTLAINPRYGNLYEVLAHFATQTRRYDEAVGFLREAVTLSPRLWSAHLALGTGLLRLGRMEEGRAAIEASFQGDAFNLWAKNTLDLLDTMKEYRELKSGDFIVRTAPAESEILSGYAAELLDEVRTRLTTKYRFTPRGPITLEIFPNHEDFAVRTLGLPGLGALGVCFGKVIAQDSPAARADSPFNWGSTLWHEFAHVITLQITDHRIPRWFSEGLSVYEEHQARPGWGDDWGPEHIRAFAAGRWFRIADIDNGFIRPKQPDDISLAYFEASQICHFIEERYGFEAILGMLKGYREKKKTPAVLLENLRLTESEFDRQFNLYIESRIERQLKSLASLAVTGRTPAAPTAKPAMPGVEKLSKQELIARAEAAPENYELNLEAGLSLYQEKNNDRAAVFLRRAIALIPWQSGSGNPYDLLARIHLERGEKGPAMEMFEAWLRADENSIEPLRRLAELKMESGDRARALELLQMSFYINPYGDEPHTTAGSLLLELKQPDKAVGEFRIAIASKPPNLAGAHFNLARALLASGDRVAAKRSLLTALEIAPTFEEGLEMLLELTGN
jgi:tetratricopeptide (TPR) repeat protein